MILVTGSTGLIGGEVLRGLSRAGVPARALTRDLQKAHTMPGVAWVAGDLGKPETLRTAFDGATTLFLLTHYYADMVALQHNAIAAARDAGLTQVVKISAFAASDHSRAPIARTLSMTAGGTPSRTRRARACSGVSSTNRTGFPITSAMIAAACR